MYLPTFLYDDLNNLDMKSKSSWRVNKVRNFVFRAGCITARLTEELCRDGDVIAMWEWVVV